MFDSVSICLSKGLGAPAGTLIVGTRAFIEEARRWRKVVGGGMRQTGFIAAAGIHALEHHIDRLDTDHANARRLADGLARIDGIGVGHNAVHTNIVYVEMAPDWLADFGSHCTRHQVLLQSPVRNPIRMVTHLDVDAGGVDRAVDVMSSFFNA